MKLEDAIEHAKDWLEGIKANKVNTEFWTDEEDEEALRLVIEELIKVRKDIDSGVLVLNGLNNTPVCGNKKQIILEHYLMVREKLMESRLWSALCFGNKDQLKAYIKKINGGE